MIEIKSKLKKSEWNEIKTSVKYSSPLQSPIYADFVEVAYGQKPVYLLGKDSSDMLQFYALLIENKKRFFHHGKIQQGPIILTNNLTEENVIFIIKKFLAERGIASLSIEIPLISPFYFSDECVEKYYETFLMDLTCSEDELMNKMSKSWRKNIRRAEKKVQIIPIESENDPLLQQFYEITIETRERVSDFGLDVDIFYLDFYRRYIQTFIKNKKGMLNIAVKGDKLLAGSGTISEGNTSLSFISASTRDLEYERGTQHFLRWEEIIWSKTHGYQWYDLGGIGPGSTSPENGIYTFKKRFGGKFIRVPIYTMYPNSINARTYRILRSIKK